MKSTHWGLRKVLILSVVLVALLPFQNCSKSGFAVIENSSSTHSQQNSVPDPNPQAAKQCLHPDTNEMLNAGTSLIYFTRNTGSESECSQAKVTSICSGLSGQFEPGLANFAECSPAQIEKPPVIQNLSANPPVIQSGQSTTLSWSVTGASSLSLSTVGNVTGKNTQNVSPASTTTYTLTATNEKGSTSLSLVVVVSSNQLPPGLPAWRVGMAPFQWKKIPGTSIASIRPLTNVYEGVDADGMGLAGGLYGRLLAWNGLAADVSKSRVYSAGSGGHADYAGNEVYEIDFFKDAPVWTIRREPTAPQFIRASNGTQNRFYDYYLDGRPSSTHTYYALQFITGKNSIFKFGAGSIYGTGNESNSYIDEFSLTTNDWALGPANRPFFGNTARGGLIAASVCKDPVTEEVYLNANDKLKKYNPMTGQLTVLASYFQNNSEIQYRACAVDPVHKQVIWFGNAYKAATGGLKYDIAKGTFEQITFTGSATHAADSWVEAYAWYDEKIGAFLLKNNSSAKIIRIDPVDYSTSVISTTGGETMARAMNGVQTRFQRLPNLKGYVYYPNDADGFWFLATE